MKSWITRLALARWCTPPCNSGPPCLADLSAATRSSFPSRYAKAMLPSPPPVCQRKLRRSMRFRSGRFQRLVDEDKLIGIKEQSAGIRQAVLVGVASQGFSLLGTGRAAKGQHIGGLDL